MSTVTNILDGYGTNTGQGQEGKAALDQYHDFLRAEYKLYAKYITLEEMEVLWEAQHMKGLNTVQRIRLRDRADKIEASIPFEQIYEETKIRLLNLKAGTKKSHQAYLLGAREFTFTYSPKWMTDTEARFEMSKGMDKLLKYYAEEIVSLRAVGEVGSNGLSHIHCFYKLVGGVKITDKNFKRAWKYWNPKKIQGFGFEGGHHATVRVESDFLGYIEKDIDGAWFERIVSRPAV